MEADTKYVCGSNGQQATIGSDNGLAPNRRQAIFWTNAGLLLNGPIGSNFSQLLIKIQQLDIKYRS